ncbi:hypothetical protein F2Q70_00027688 [Brassica cretica]|uniref:Uncharacterized protein n=1 Tax=Brassica cretica TaxID=69181 RepID=A0A8S9LFM3_BRACR|nr:hypothetical protein F2Q70_00027688 [Brassica cretica]
MFDPFVRRRLCRNLSSSSTNGRRLSVAYHIVPQCLSFIDLRLLQPLSRLPTLLPGNSIVVTNNSVSGFAVDGVLVTEPDLFLSSQIFCFVTMGYGQLVIGRTMNVVNLDPAAEIFNYPVAMKSDWDSLIRKCQHSPWSWTKKHKYDVISEKKVSTSIEVLCKNCPSEFVSYFHYRRSLISENLFLWKM